MTRVPVLKTRVAVLAAGLFTLAGASISLLWWSLPTGICAAAWVLREYGSSTLGMTVLAGHAAVMLLLSLMAHELGHAATCLLLGRHRLVVLRVFRVGVPPRVPPGDGWERLAATMEVLSGLLFQIAAATLLLAGTVLFGSLRNIAAATVAAVLSVGTLTGCFAEGADGRELVRLWRRRLSSKD